MNRIFLYIVCMIIYSGTAKAQVVSTSTLNDFYKQFKNNQFNTGDFGRNTDIKGSPYENDDFVEGLVVTNSDTRFAGVPMRYNNYSNQIEFTDQDGKVLIFGMPELISYVLIGDRKIIYCPYSIGNRITKGFLAVLTEGKTMLLVKRNAILKPAEEPAAYKEAVPPTYVKISDDYFIRIGGADAKRVDNKKDLMAIINTHQIEIEKFIKKNKTKFAKAEDLSLLIEYYNSLEE